MAKYTQGAQKEIAKEMRAFKKGEAHIGKSNKKVKSKQQAVAIGLYKARDLGEKVPKK